MNLTSGVGRRATVAAVAAATVALSGCGGASQPQLPAQSSANNTARSNTMSVYNSTCNNSSAGTITEYTLPTTNSQPWGMVVDPSGTLWIAERNQNAIATFNTITDSFGSAYSTPTKSSDPLDVTIGPDGNPWFVEFAAAKYGTINSGTVTEYSLPRNYPEAIDSLGKAKNSQMWISMNNNGSGAGLEEVNIEGTNSFTSTDVGPYGISLDSNLDVWFTSYNTGYIEVNWYGGGNSSWAINSNYKPSYITEGPNNVMYFTEHLGNKIDAIPESKTGTLTSYTVPTSGSEPYGIVGACGRVWFAETSGNKIGELNPSTGTITEYTIPTSGAEPVWVTTDPYGNVWFSEYGANKIGMITTQNAP